MNIKQFEKILNKNIEDIQLADIIENLLNGNFSADEIVNLLDKIIEKNQTRINFIKSVNTIKYTFQIIQNYNILDKLLKDFNEEKIDDEQLRKKLENFIEFSTDPIFVLTTVNCIVLSVEGIDLKKHLEKIKKSVLEIQLLFDKIGSIEESFKLRCDLIDLLFNLEVNLFNEINEKIDTKWVSLETKKLQKYYDSLTKRELPKINVKPEQLGFIDITKLKKE